MPVRTVSAPALSKVTESIDPNGPDGVALTSTTVDAEAVMTTGPKSRIGTVNLDFVIGSHAITYSKKGYADSTSKAESRTVRQHEYGHVGARNALASSAVLTSLCTAVQVNWTFSVPTTGDDTKDQAAEDAAKASYESAVVNYIEPFIEYLDELVLHAARRAAGVAGVPTDTDLATMLAGIKYTDPATGQSRTPNQQAIDAAKKATAAGEKTGEAHAKATPTPDAVK